MSAAPSRADVLADVTFYLDEAASTGADRAYRVRQTRLGMGLVIEVTDIDSMEHSEWDLVLTPRINAPSGAA